MKTRKHRFLALLLCLALLIAALSATVLAENAGNGADRSPDMEDIGDRIGPDQVGDWTRQDVPECDPEKAANCEHSQKYGIYTGRIFDPTCTAPGGIIIEWYCVECNTYMGESHLAMDGEAWQPHHILESIQDSKGRRDCRKGYRCVVCGKEFTNGTYSHKMVYEYVDEKHHTGHCVNPGCDFRLENELHDFGDAVTANDKCELCGYEVYGNGSRVTPTPMPTATPVRTPKPTATPVPTATPHVHKLVYKYVDEKHHQGSCADCDLVIEVELHDFGDAVTATDKCVKCGVVVKPDGARITPTPAPTKAPTPVPTAVPTPTPTLVPIDPNNPPVPATAVPAKPTAAPAATAEPTAEPEQPAKPTAVPATAAPVATAEPTAEPEQPAKPTAVPATAAPAATAEPTAVPEGPAKPTAVPEEPTNVTAAPTKPSKPNATAAPAAEPVAEPAPAVEAEAPAAAPAAEAPAAVPAAVPAAWKEVAEKLTFTEVKEVEVVSDASVSDVVVRQAEIHDEYDAYMALTVEWKADDEQAAGSVLHMSMPVEVEAEIFKLVRVEEDGTLTEVEFTYEDGVLSFDAEDVALYLLVPVE